jgi:hypothetical protein
VELRRALLLFAVVLGLAALASSLSRPNEDENGGEGNRSNVSSDRATARDEGRPRPAERRRAAEATQGDTATIRFGAGGRPETHRLEAGAAATVLVEVGEPGEVRLEGLGLTQPADPLTPARFDLLVERPGPSRVVTEPAGGGSSEVIGTLVVEKAR